MPTKICRTWKVNTRNVNWKWSAKALYFLWKKVAHLWNKVARQWSKFALPASPCTKRGLLNRLANWFCKLWSHTSVRLRLSSFTTFYNLLELAWFKPLVVNNYSQVLWCLYGEKSLILSQYGYSTVYKFFSSQQVNFLLSHPLRKRTTWSGWACIVYTTYLPT